MKYKNHIKKFFIDHIWVIITFFMAPVGFFVIFSALYGIKFTDILYYIFLSTFILLCALVYRLYATWNLYEQFCNKSDNINDYVLSNQYSRLEENYQNIINNIRVLHKSEINRLYDEKNNHKLMIYQWVHQIKTPLSVIQLTAEEHKSDTEYIRILNSVDKMHYNLDQILNMYKIDAIENDFLSERINLYELTRDCVNDSKSFFIKNHIYPKLDIDKEIVIISDKKWLKFVINQLLTNAIKYSKSEGLVVIRAIKTDDGVKLEVKDSGCGIKPDELDRIYDLFFCGTNGRTHGDSSGLGLYMVKKILEHLGHNIEVVSQIDNGTTFTITFI